MDWKDIKALFANTPKDPLVWGDEMYESDDEDDDSDAEEEEFENDNCEPVIDVKGMRKRQQQQQGSNTKSHKTSTASVNASSTTASATSTSGPVISVVTSDDAKSSGPAKSTKKTSIEHTESRAGLKQQAAQSGESLYGRQLDSKDEQWVSRQRPKNARASDATLSCPACFTTVCFDCQRHVKYKNQFRAMFVRNCKLKSDQRLTGAPGEEYTPVACETCGTEVAVYDSDEVYHFFNVLPGEPPIDTSER